jgi:hypothetical protein
MVMDLLQETEMVDAFLEFFLTHPATHSQGSLQIDLILISLTLLKFVDKASSSTQQTAKVTTPVLV